MSRKYGKEKYESWSHDNGTVFSRTGQMDSFSNAAATLDSGLAQGYADTIYNAAPGLGNLWQGNNDAVTAIFQNTINCKTDYNFLKQKFQQSYGVDMLQYIQNTLGIIDVMDYVNAMENC